MKICIPHKSRAIGGPSIFVRKLVDALKEHGVSVTYDINEKYDLLLVISTYDGFLNRKMREKKNKGVKIVQRLDGIYTFATSKFLYPIYNFGMKYVLHKLADYIVYQSNYSKLMCDKYLGRPSCEYSIIYNGVNVQDFCPEGNRFEYKQKHVLFSASVFRRKQQLEPMLKAMDYVAQEIDDALLVLAGTSTQEMKRFLSKYERNYYVKHIGRIPNEKLPFYERGANLFMFPTPNPFCPNSVIEALACGLPVASYDTGAMRELIGEDAGVLAKHKGNDLWRFSNPDPHGLVEAALEILKRNEYYKKAARNRAVKMFSIKKISEQYIRVFENTLVR